MELYKRIRDVAKVVQQTDNTVLYKQLIELSVEVFEIENEVAHSLAENAKLKKEKENCIVRHVEPYITLDDDPKTLYCSRCWDCDHHLVQVKCYSSGSFKCTHCANNGIYDHEKWND